MKRLLITLFSLLLLAGCSAIPGEEESLDTESAEEITEETGPCKIIGTWKMVIPSDDGNLYITGVFNADGTNEGDFCVGTADSIEATLRNTEIDKSVPLNTGYFGLYEMNGDNIKIEAENISSTFTGVFIDETHISGSWVNNNRGTSGIFTAEKISN